MIFFRLISILYQKVKSKYQFFVFARKWRKQNAHNSIVPTSIFPIEIATIGEHSYGSLNIEHFGNSNENLIIGNYVSIANRVTFILGGNHSATTITNYPLYSKLIELAPDRDAQTKGSIIIEDEVWIGFGAIILSGVRIGKGAIIGAGAIISNDIPAYAVAVGNPSKIIKFRFNEEIRNELHDFSLSDYDESIIIDNIKEFYTPLNLDQLNKLKKLKTK